MAKLKINYYSTRKKAYLLPPHHAPSLLLGIAVPCCDNLNSRITTIYKSL